MSGTLQIGDRVQHTAACQLPRGIEYGQGVVTSAFDHPLSNGVIVRVVCVEWSSGRTAKHPERSLKRLEPPECSICRRRHGSEIVHACE